MNKEVEATDAVTTDAVDTDGVTTDAVTTDGVTTDGVDTNGVTTDGVTTDAVNNSENSTIIAMTPKFLLQFQEASHNYDRKTHCIKNFELGSQEDKKNYLKRNGNRLLPYCSISNSNKRNLPEISPDWSIQNFGVDCINYDSFMANIFWDSFDIRNIIEEDIDRERVCNDLCLCLAFEEFLCSDYLPAVHKEKKKKNETIDEQATTDLFSDNTRFHFTIKDVGLTIASTQTPIGWINDCHINMFSDIMNLTSCVTGAVEIPDTPVFQTDFVSEKFLPSNMHLNRQLSFSELSDEHVYFWLKFGKHGELLRLVYSVMAHNSTAADRGVQKIPFPDKYFIPFNELNRHWTLLVVELRSFENSPTGNVAHDSRLYYIDSMGCTNPAKYKGEIDCVSKLFGVTSHVVTSSRQFREEGVYIGGDDTPVDCNGSLPNIELNGKHVGCSIPVESYHTKESYKQKNGMDCGIHVLINILLNQKYHAEGNEGVVKLSQVQFNRNYQCVLRMRLNYCLLVMKMFCVFGSCVEMLDVDYLPDKMSRYQHRINRLFHHHLFPRITDQKKKGKCFPQGYKNYKKPKEYKPSRKFSHWFSIFETNDSATNSIIDMKQGEDIVTEYITKHVRNSREQTKSSSKKNQKRKVAPKKKLPLRNQKPENNDLGTANSFPLAPLVQAKDLNVPLANNNSSSSTSFMDTAHLETFDNNYNDDLTPTTWRDTKCGGILKSSCNDFEYTSTIRSRRDPTKLVSTTRKVSVYKEVEYMILSRLKQSIQGPMNKHLQSFRNNVKGHLYTLGAYVLSDYIYQLKPDKSVLQKHSAPNRSSCRSNQRMPLASLIAEDGFTIEFDNDKKEDFCVIHHIATEIQSEGFGYAATLLSKYASNTKTKKLLVFLPPDDWFEYSSSQTYLNAKRFLEKVGFKPAKFSVNNVPNGISVMSVPRRTLSFLRTFYVPATIKVNHYDPTSITKITYGPRGWDGNQHGKQDGELQDFRDRLLKEGGGNKIPPDDYTYYGFHQTFGWREIKKDDTIGVSEQLLDDLRRNPCRYSEQLIGKRKGIDREEDDQCNNNMKRLKNYVCETDMTMCQLVCKNRLLPKLNENFTSSKNIYCLWFSACLSLGYSQLEKIDKVEKYFYMKENKDCFKEMNFIESIVSEEFTLQYHLRKFGLKLRKMQTSKNKNLSNLEYILSDDFNDNVIVRLQDQNGWSGHSVCIVCSEEIKMILDPSEKFALELNRNNLSKCCGKDCSIQGIHSAYEII